MAPTLISVEEYLSNTYRPDCDYVDGEVLERNSGEFDHSRLQGALALWCGNRQRAWNVWVLPEQRVQVKATRFRIPDVSLVSRDYPVEPIITRPPLVCIEILSTNDTVRRMQQRAADYLAFGVPNVWIIDPETRRAYVCSSHGFVEPEGGVLIAGQTGIEIPLVELFADLD